MRRMERLMFAVAVVCAMGVAQAGFSGGQDTQNLPNDTDVTLTLPKFNTSLGTLTNVYVEVELRLNNANVQMDNDADQPQEATGRVINVANSFTSSATLLKSDFSTINLGNLGINAFQAFNLAQSQGDPVGVFNATGLSDYASWSPGLLTGGNSGDIASTVWNDYKGGAGDTFTIAVNTTYMTTATFVGDNGFFQGNTPNGEFYGKVVYTYTPEPGTLSMLVLGGLALIRRCRK
jgi:hypothetical protein